MSLKLYHPNNPVFNTGEPRRKSQFRITSSMIGDDLAKNADEAILLARASGWDSWINSDPLLISHLDDEDNEAFLFFISETVKRKLVMIDFFDYSILHCHRGMKYIREWHERYKASGLVIIGVHSPIFSYAKDKKSVMDAANYYDINWPIVLDNDHAIWKAVKNNAWPKRILLDADRNTILDITEEGHYDLIEKTIQEQLRILSPGLACPLLLKPLYKPDPAGDEMFFGMNYRLRIANSTKPEALLEEVHYENSPEMKTQHWPKTLNIPCLEGRWVFRDESIHPSLGMVNPYLGEYSVNMNFKARDVYVVVGAKSKNPTDVPKPMKMQILLNDKPVIDDFFGEDLTYSESRKTQITMRDPRIFHILSNVTDGPHQLKLIIDNEGYDTIELFAIYLQG